MKIKNRLNLNTIISIGAVVLIILSLAWSYHEDSNANRNMDLVEDIRNVVFERNVLRDDYLLHGEDRAKVQWLAKSETLRRLLDVADQRFTESDERRMLQKAWKDFDATHASFSSFMEHQKRKDPGSARDFNLTGTESLLISQTFLKAYSLTHSINKLVVTVNQKAVRVRERSIVIVVFFMFVGIVVIVINSLALNRLLNKRIAALGKGIEIIGSGDLEYRIDAQGDDELSVLALGANEMAEKLKMSHTSVENLRQEIAERKRLVEERRVQARELTSLINNVPGIVYRGYRDWSISFISAEVEPVTGYPPDTFTSGAVGWKEIIHPDDLEQVKEAFRKAEKEKSDTLRVEYRIRNRDGGIRWIADRRQLTYEESGAFATVDGLLLDITEQKNRERSLKESEEQLREIFEGSKDGILLADVESRKFYTDNQASCDMLQHSLDEIRQLGVSDIHPEEDLPWILEGFDRQARQEIEVLNDTPVKRKDGSVLWAEISANPVTISGKTYLKGNFRDVTERRKAEERLTLLGMAVDQAAEGIVITDTEGRIEYVNPSFERMTGYLQKEAVGQNMRILKSGKQDEMFYKNMWETISRGEVWRGRFTNKKKDRTLYEEEAVISPVRNASGKIVHFVAGKRDITRDVILQKQVQTAQRMDSVGTLAGGIAHDFNNALTGIMGVAELLRLKVGENPDVSRNLDLLETCARQASTLTRQLLTFSRRQVTDPVNLDLNVVVSEMVKLVGKVIGEHIEVKIFLDKGLPTTKLDRGQVEQVIMNLCLNARDAMPSGGRLLLETADVTVHAEYVDTHPYVTPGRYAQLTVSDTGTGMDKETLGKVFEPFFTTKPVGQGTGLGLSSVYGIVKQSGGFIHAYSEPGNGSSFRVYFPAVEAPPDVVPGKRREEAVRGGTETILLAEDEESLRALAERILTGFGYTVLVARDGEEAVEVLDRNVNVDLAVLDVVMPRKGGMEAYEEMRKKKPNLKVLFMSGYSAGAVHESFVLTPGIPFLPKPYTPSSLARKMREVLDGK
jgi:PAS domain S-box-containing protein